ncbi:MAG: methyltransferase domain-containing protein [Gammaproteobacteria bacterium]|nr:methyltransferase domain-containing protein [Gammaproteobacteria bacterium]
MTDRLSAEQWSEYWRKGTITTFHGRFGQNYDGKVRDYWHGILDRLPTNARIVDLATGNGAIALIAAQHGRRHGKQLEITAVDYAEINPTTLFSNTPFAQDLRGIRFLSNTPIEATGLPDHACDLAMSQFGLEYADADAAVAEIARLLKRREAVFAAMVHHADSAIVRQAREGVEQILACEKSGLHAAIRDLLGRLDKLAARGKDAADDERAKALRTAINRILASLNQWGRQYGDPGQIVYYIENSMATFNPRVSGGMSLADRLAMLRQVAAETEAYKQRMRDLTSAALDDAAIVHLAQQIQGAGFRIDDDRPFVFEGTHFCHVLSATR